MRDALVLGTLNYSAEVPWLEGTGANAYSQYGEDGLIAAAFQRIGCKNNWCFEVGAADGVFYSNTAALRDIGWSAVLLESSWTQYCELRKHASQRVTCRHVSVDNLDAELATVGAPIDIDFGVIDVDGQDYWLWHDLLIYRPRIVLVEFHWADGDQYIPPRSKTCRKQAGEGAMRRLAAAKGYKVVARTHVNLLCVAAECLSN